MSTWRDRVRKSIILIAPNGSEFEALWIGGVRQIDKRLGLFDYPKFPGTVIQDLNVSGSRYPLSFFFEGPNHDITSTQFMEACKQTGVWKVVHPTKGRLVLQLLTVSEHDQPVKSGNITKFETEWIEPAELSVRTSTPQLAVDIENQSDVVTEIASDQFVANVKQGSAADTLAVKSATNATVSSVTDNLKAVYERVPALNSRISSIVRGIQDNITQSTIDTKSLAGQIQNLIDLPVLATDDISVRLRGYGKLVLGLIGLTPPGTTFEDKNVVMVQELSLSASLVALARTATSGTLNSRKLSVATAETISEFFINITDNLDASQESFAGEAITAQYFSQSVSYPDMSRLIGQVIAYLMLASFDLAVEKRIVLDRPRCPVEIAIAEYHGPGVGDRNIDLFIDSNELKGNDCCLLPAGREVVIYAT